MTRRSWWVLALVIAALALAASAKSLSNGFAYDDVYLIVKAKRMHTLAALWREFAHTYWPEESGGDGYRPLTIIAFRLQWALGGGSPVIFHAVNVTLHAIASIVVFWLACGMLPLAAAWVVGALYAVHPVHVEAFANIVGQSELWVALLVSLAVALYVHGRAAGPLTTRRWGTIAGLYAAALLFKEHAIVLPALILLAEFTVVSDRTRFAQRATALRVPVLLLTIIGLGYMWARSRVVVGGLSGFQPYIVFQALNLSAANRVLTMIGAAPEWLRLFLWPARLMTEYAPPYIDIAQGPSVSQLRGLFVLLAVFALMIACWRRSPTTSFGIGWVIVTLLPASNFLIPAGFIIAERTLLLPSVGAMLAVGSAVPWVYAQLERRPAAQYVGYAAVAVLLGLGIVRSAARSHVWHDNDTLFRQAIQDSPESYRAHFMLGVHLFENRRLTEGEAQYRKALQLFPYDPLMAYALAEQYRDVGRCEPAITLYRWFYTLQPETDRGHLAFASCLLLTFRFDSAKVEALKSIRLGGKYSTARDIIRAADRARDSLKVRRARGDTTSQPMAPAPLTPSR